MLADDDWGSPIAARVAELVRPILTDLALELYDCEYAGGVLRITAHQQGGANLDTLALATRLISRELDHVDPVPGRYTLEVTSPGLERSLRRPAHFASSVGTEVTVRLSGESGDDRRIRGMVTAVDDTTVTITPAGGEARQVPFDRIDRAKTVFEWGSNAAPRTPSRGRPKSATNPSRTTEVTA